ncbi:MFS transporter [Maricaulis sp.]|uniref:MFS transporter n=1 Tax=Maricaulis sp. TaxID=1486257 RepID=UPI003A943690
MSDPDCAPEPENLPANRFGIGRRASYGAGDIGFVLVWQGAALFLLYFYTDILHLPPWTAGAIYLAGMIWDAVSDPLIATWAERRAARTGRYTPIIAWSALPVGLSYVWIFSIPADGGISTAIGALVSHLVFRTAFTCAGIPYNALPAKLTRDSDARTSLAALRVVGAAIGGLAVAIATPLLVQGAAGSGEAGAYHLAAAATGGVAAAVLLLSSLGIREPRTVAAAPATTGYLGDLGALWPSLWRNGPLQRLLAMMLLATVGFGLFTQNMLYFLNHVLARPELTVPVLASPALAMILTAPLWMVLAARSSKRLAMLAGLGTATTGYLLLGLAPAADAALTLTSVGLVGVGSAALPVMFWSMVPDVIDYGQLRTGRRVEARTFGLTTFVQKSAAGVTALIIGGLLGWAGYSPGAAQTPAAQSVIITMISWLPAICMVIIAGVVWGYPIDRRRHREIIAQLAEQDEPAGHATRSGG